MRKRTLTRPDPVAASPQPSARSAGAAGATAEAAHSFARLPVSAPALQRQPDDAGSPGGWDDSLLWVDLTSDDADCFGSATTSGVDHFSGCHSPIRAPFCQSLRVPFEVAFLVDRAGRPHPRPSGPRSVSASFELRSTGGRVLYSRSETDPAPRYAGPNAALEPSFGKAFPVGTTEGGILAVRLVLRDGGTVVTYTDSIALEVTPCT